MSNYLMQDFLEYVVKGLVERADAAIIEPTERNGITVYQLKLHPSDMGKIIGKQGNTINAIRTLIQAGSAKQGNRCVLEVVEGKADPEVPPAEQGG